MAVLTLSPEVRDRALRRQGAGLWRLRDRAGLTQVAMADRLSISVQNYRAYEAGEQVLTILHLISWAPVFGITPAKMADELGFLRDDPPGTWWGRAELEAEGMEPHDIDRHEATLIDQPVENQRAVIDMAIRALRQKRRREGGAGTGDNGDSLSA